MPSNVAPTLDVCAQAPAVQKNKENDTAIPTAT